VGVGLKEKLCLSVMVVEDSILELSAKFSTEGEYSRFLFVRFLMIFSVSGAPNVMSTTLIL
jgi:hypothetical protein